MDQIVTGYEKLGTHEEETITLGQEIVTLDADNQAGLKVKYGFRTLLAEAGRLRQERKIDEALAAYEKAIALPGISDEQRQDAYFDQGACYFSKRNFSAVVACLEHARDAAPNSSKAEQLEVMLKRFTPIAAAQTEVTEINSELEKAEGIARAKVLDRLIEAQKTLSKAIPDSKLAQKVEVWTKEIIELDADNQAGLKAKYEKKLEAKE